MRRIHIFRAGAYTTQQGDALRMSREDLRAVVRAYDAEKNPAPLVIGHPRAADAAHGWVADLSAAGDDLYARAERVTPELTSLVEQGRFRRISASFFRPDSRSNPTPGIYHLRHVGFLGAAAPAVPNLEPIELAGGEEDVETIELDFAAEEEKSLFRTVARMYRSLREFLIGEKGLEVADQVLPAWEAAAAERDAAKVEMDDALPAEDSFAAPEGAAEQAQTKTMKKQETHSTDQPSSSEATVSVDFTALKEENDRLSTRIAELETEAEARRREAYASFAERIISSGRALPRHQGAIVELLAVAEASDATVDFAEEGGEQPLADALRTMLEELPATVDFAERTRGAALPLPGASKGAPSTEAIHKKMLEAEQNGTPMSVADAEAVCYEEMAA